MKSKNTKMDLNIFTNSTISKRASFDIPKKINIKNIMISDKNSSTILKKLRKKLTNQNMYIFMLEHFLEQHHIRQQKIFRSLKKFHDDLNTATFVNRLKELAIDYNET